MGLESYKRYQDLNDLNYFPPRIGFGPKVTGGDINRLNARINLAKSFRGINLDGISEKTVAGYNAFFQVILTHSAIERFAEVHGHSRNLDTMGKPMLSHDSERVAEGFFANDKKGRFSDFLSERITDKNLKAKFGACRGGESSNVAHISAVVRHIFAHGYLCANVNGMSPKSIHSACMSISDFLLQFMDAEFTKKIDACYDRIAAKEPPGGSS
ncbi:MAG: hypothetical protein WKF44_04990 [Rubrobacteraceae bacterium]